MHGTGLSLAKLGVVCKDLQCNAFYTEPMYDC